VADILLAPHVGHLYTMVLTDVLKRWQTLAGRRALLVTGTDEHGMKIQRAAALSDVAPKEFCDENSAKFETLAEKARIDFDRFIRTTDPDHAHAVEHFWFLLREKGLIYESKHEGWYCVSDECFYPESLVDKKQDPFTGEVFMASTESGNKVEWTEEKTYHFRMTELRDQLLQFYEQNPGWVTPASQMKQVVDWVKNNLEDLSISRPVDRLSWGIRVPDDPSQTIYVWVDALINYLTMAGFPVWPPGEESKGGWPADVHVIGKDILRFHCVYWPALLLAVGIPLPKKVLSHAHWTMNRAKMSKSVGNVVNPFYAIDRWGVDLVRFYLVHDGGIVDDADYNNEIIVERYKKLLQSGLGNLTSRITRPNLWSVRDSVVAAGNERSPTSKTVIEDALSSHLELLEGLAAAVSGHMERLNPSAALRQVMDAVDKVRFHATRRSPKKSGKTDAETDKQVPHHYGAVGPGEAAGRRGEQRAGQPDHLSRLRKPAARGHSLAAIHPRHGRAPARYHGRRSGQETAFGCEAAQRRQLRRAHPEPRQGPLGLACAATAPGRINNIICFRQESVSVPCPEFSHIRIASWGSASSPVHLAHCLYMNLYLEIPTQLEMIWHNAKREALRHIRRWHGALAPLLML